MTKAEYLKALRVKAAAEGKCYQCRARPAKEGRRTCQHCLSAHEARKKAHLSAGRCMCGRAPRPGTSTCERCAERATQSHERFIERAKRDGVCRVARSHGPVSPGLIVCEACRAKLAAKTLDAYHQRVALGLCAQHGCRLNATSRLWCHEHHEQVKAYQRAYYARKKVA